MKLSLLKSLLCVTLLTQPLVRLLAEVPAEILNLTNWYLTLPIGPSENPTLIKQPQLSTFDLAPYFRVPTTPNRVLFRAHCGGTTTEGSDYPRSELREMKNNGKDQASWSTTSGTHTMEITQKITHLPDVKKHVVAGQIHGSKSDIIVCRLEGKKLFLDHNGAEGKVLTTNYTLGDTFTIKFVASGGKIKSYYNGTLVETYSKSASGCYFKAGCYTQSNTSKGDDSSAYGEVAIYSLKVTHN